MDESIRSQLWDSQLRQYERETNVEPHARLLKVVIARIELQQEDPYCLVGTLIDLHFKSHDTPCIYLGFDWIRLSMFGQQSPALGSTLIASLTLCRVMRRVERKDEILLGEVVDRAVNSIRGALFSHRFDVPEELQILSRSFKCNSNSVSASEPGSQLAFACNAAVVAVLHLLAFVFQYLIGYVDRGGSKTFSSGAFDFRATFVSLVLFQGAYVWIKFRQAVPPLRNAPDTTIDAQLLDGVGHKRIYRRKTQIDGGGGGGGGVKVTYEPRFIPPRSKRLSLGGYDTRVQAMIVLQIARSYYDENMDKVCLPFEDVSEEFSIPPMSEPARRLTGEWKREWVESNARKVGEEMFCDLITKRRKLESAVAVEAGPHVNHGNGAGSSGPSSCAPPLTCSSPAMLADEPAIVSDAPSTLNSPLVPFEEIGRDSDYSPWDFPDSDGIYERGFPNHPAQPSIPDRGQEIYEEFAQILEAPSSPRAATRSIAHLSEPEVRPGGNLQQRRALVAVGSQNIDGRGSSVFLQQSDPVLQQVVLCEQKLPEDTAGQFADLDHRLTVCRKQNSVLQKEKEFSQLENSKLRKEKECWELEKVELRTENERLKSKLRDFSLGKGPNS